MRTEPPLAGPAENSPRRWRRVAVVLVVAVAVTVGAGILLGGRGERRQPIRADHAGLWVSYAARDRVEDLAVAPGGDVWAATRGGVAHRSGEGWTTQTVEDGLPHTVVTSVDVGDDTVWVGTRAGVAAYQEGGWVVHDGEDALGDDVVRAVAVGPDGAVWAASGAALARFDGQAWTRVDRGADDVAVADDGTVWAVGPGVDGAVRVLEADGWVEHTEHTTAGPLHDRDDAASAVTVADDGTVWVGTNRGVSRFDGERWHRHPLEEADVGTTDVADVAPAGAGAAWVATRGEGGVWRVDGGRWTAVSEGLPEGGQDAHPRWVTALAVADDGTVWAGLNRDGTARLDEGTWHVDRPAAELPARVHVRALERVGDTLWVGTDASGVWRGDDERWVAFTAADGLPSNRVWSLAAAPDGTVWAGTDGGLARFDGERWSPAGDAGPRRRVVWAVAADEVGLWAGTDAGLWQDYGHGWTHHTTDDGLPDDRVRSVTAAGGRVWAGTESGLALLDVGSEVGWRAVPADEALADTAVWAVTVDDETVWAATLDDGADAVVAFDRGRPQWTSRDWARYTDADGVLLPVIDLAVAGDGAVWAGGRSGASRYADGSWTRYVVPGVGSTAYATVAPAGGASVWVGGGEGVGRLHPAPAGR